MLPHITYDRYSLQINGQGLFVRSGAMHYFRLPHPDLWRDRLQKLKAASYNTVDIYFNWDFHSKAPGQYDFTGIRDIKHLLDIIEETGLYLIARPGPYINAETTRGGLPGWLLTQPGVIPRNRDEGAYVHSAPYMAFVKEWFDQILPFIKDRPNLLMVQIENEYSTLDMEPDYMEELLAMVRAHGITVPSMHNDFYAAGLYADIVDIYAIDNYTVTAFDTNWRNFPDIFTVLDQLEEEVRPEFCPDRPLMMAELQAGWFASWKTVPYEAIHENLGRQHISLVTRSFLGQGGTLFNHYKAIGGTNWDHIGATDAYTSYDFSAPISETGLPTERLYEAKRINLLLSHFNLLQTQRAQWEDIGLAQTAGLYTLRQDVNHPKTYWIFTRNLTPEPLQIALSPDVFLEVPPYQAQIIPHNLTLANGWQLQQVNVEPLAQTLHTLILPGGEQKACVVLKTNGQSPLSTPNELQVSQTEDSTYQIALKAPLTENQLVSLSFEDYTLHFLGTGLTDRLWQMDDGTFYIGPDLVRDPDTLLFETPSRPYWQIDTDGRAQEQITPQPTALNLPTLSSWECFSGDTLVWENSAFQAISASGADMDSNGLHQGIACYQYHFEGKAKTLHIRAQHLWTVFLNGVALFAHHTLHIPPEKGGAEDTIAVNIPQDLLQETTNTVTVLVESLGHHKGFYEDTQTPLGILNLELDGQDICKIGKIKALKDIQEAMLSTLPHWEKDSALVYAKTQFVLDIPENTYAPMGLEIDLDIERVNITLNNTLIGKYWRSCKCQTRFYLPEGILNLHGKNELILTLNNTIPLLSVAKGFPMGYGTVRLLPYTNMVKLF